jgi:hypothetical protein
MVMFGQAERLAQPLTRRQKRVIGLVLAVALALAGWVVVHSSASPTSANGCVNVIIAGSTGGGLLSHCGAAARTWCASELSSSGALALRIQAQCRLAGLEPHRH